MNRPPSYVLALALALLALPAPALAQDEFERQVRDQLDAVSEGIRDNGFTLVHEIYIGRLDDNGEETVTFDLGRGQTYMIMGVCDTDCSDLDLVLHDGDGDEVDSDLELDDAPIVEVSVDRADSYSLEVTMAACEAEPCRFGIGVYGRAGSSSSSASSKSTGTGSEPNWRATPTYGAIDLDAGFSPDPYEKAISAGGDDQVDLDAPNCSGYIHAEAPDLDLNYEAGSLELYIYARAKIDVTLIVNQPDGSWICNDDEMGTDPMIRLQSPRSGNYNIWIGTYEASESPLPPATIYISEIDPT
jgi:serine protease Do